jgi:hypothetical protein
MGKRFPAMYRVLGASLSSDHAMGLVKNIPTIDAGTSSRIRANKMFFFSSPSDVVISPLPSRGFP